MKLLKIDANDCRVSMTLDEIVMLKNGLFYLSHMTNNAFSDEQLQDVANFLKDAERHIRDL
jgi:hypothetical protein